MVLCVRWCMGHSRKNKQWFEQKGPCKCKWVHNTFRTSQGVRKMPKSWKEKKKKNKLGRNLKALFVCLGTFICENHYSRGQSEPAPTSAPLHDETLSEVQPVFCFFGWILSCTSHLQWCSVCDPRWRKSKVCWFGSRKNILFVARHNCTCRRGW